MGLQKCFWCVLVCVVCFFSFIVSDVKSSSDTVEGTVVINGKDPIAETDENYICATVDMWPPEKCDYGTCSWGNSSFFNLDLTNKILFNAVKEFSPMRIRLGGTLQDRYIFHTEDSTEPCEPFYYDPSLLYNYTIGCLSAARWDELNSFFQKSGAVITVGLNVLTGKEIEDSGIPMGPANATLIATGPWDYSNSEAFIRYTVEKGYKVYGWVLGNELGGIPVYLRVDPEPYAVDTFALYKLIQEIYKDFDVKPIILSPGGLFEHGWFKSYIEKTEGALSAISHHIYNLGAGADEDLIYRVLDVNVLDTGAEPLRDVRDVLKETGTSTVGWVGESGGAFNSGGDGVSNVFVYSFWYLDILGMAATYETKVYCRQTLIGGNYGLLDTTTFVPNPDYYSALLWHRLMGTSVLSTKFDGIRNLRAYAHCAKQSEGITILLINIDGNTTVKANLDISGTSVHVIRSDDTISLTNSGEKVLVSETVIREEYRLTPLNGDIRSKTVLLNGKALLVDSDTGAIPALEPVTVTSSSEPITVGPYSILFVHMPNVVLPACKLDGVEAL